MESFAASELRDAASSCLAGHPVEDSDKLRGNTMNALRDSEAGDGITRNARSSVAHVPSLGDFTTGEYERLSQDAGVLIDIPFKTVAL